jgi:hypothetical protein
LTVTGCLAVIGNAFEKAFGPDRWLDPSGPKVLPALELFLERTGALADPSKAEPA